MTEYLQVPYSYLYVHVYILCLSTILMFLEQTNINLSGQIGFDAVGGLTSHIAALKEMVVFPLLYPEVFDKFKIESPK